MSVLVLGVLSYPSLLPNLDQDITAFDFQLQLANVAFADDEEEEEEDDDKFKLEAKLIDPSTREDDGKAKFEERSDRTRLSVEIEDQERNTTFDVVLSSSTITTITTNDDEM